MAEIKITSHKAERLKEITDNLEKKMGQVGAIVERQAKINVSKSPPEHPQVQTGRLRSSITHREEISHDEIATLIGSNVSYASYLEFGTINHSPFPWLFPAVEMSRDKIIETLGSKFGVEKVE